MWDREFAKAKWNNVEFNILKTTVDGGKQLHVEDMPYSDTPYVAVMGSATQPYKFDAVFVGPDSLANANDFIIALSDEPVGYLEHPYLGELDLVYKRYSQSFTTKKGIVTLSLEFIKQGKEVDVVGSFPSLEKIIAVVKEKNLEDQVKTISAATLSEIAEIKNDYTSVLTSLKNLANQLQQPGQKLSALHREVSDGIAAINSITNSPFAFVQQIQLVFDSLVNQAKTISIGSSLNNNALNKRVFASKELNKKEKTTTSHHLASTIVLAKIDLNLELEQLTTNNIESTVNDIDTEVKNLITSVNNQINKVASLANYDTLDLVENLESLKSYLIEQRSKVIALQNNIEDIDVVSETPALLIAYENNTDTDTLNKHNQFEHPLFVTGRVSVPNE